MHTNTENEKGNAKLAQFKHAVDIDLFQYKYDMKWIIEKMNNVNYKFASTNYLQADRANWIGYTALHFAADEGDLEALDILLDHGADFTAQNSTNETSLHRIMEFVASSVAREHRLDNKYVNLFLAAHLKYSNFQNPTNNYGFSHFHIACAANNLEVVRGLINSGAPIHDAVKMDSSSFAGFSPLHFAARFCAFDVADLLLSHDAYIHLKDARGMTPLYLALERKIEIISDIDLNRTVRDTNERLLKLLLDKEKNNSMEITNKWGLSHLHVCCTLNDFKIAEHILQNTGNVNSIVNMDSPFWPGYTPLHFAALCNFNTVKLLMKRGADMNVKNAKGVTPFDLCIERYNPQDIYAILSLNSIWKNIALSDGKTKLSELVFAMRNSKQFELFLKKLSKNFSICDSPLWPGCSPMHLAVIFSRKNVEESTEVNLEILKILHKQSPCMLYSQDVHGYTPFHLAFRLNKKSVLELLMKFLQECPNLVNRSDEDGLSFLHIACAQNNNILLKRLLTMGLNVNAKYEGKSSILDYIWRGSTPLHFAVVSSNMEAVETLMTFGADIYAKNAYDMTPIHMVLSAERMKRKKVGSILLKSSHIRDSVVNGIGLSHLHVACYCASENEEVIEYLLDKGADVNGIITYKPNASEQSGELSFLETYANCSSLHIAVEVRNCDVVSLLVSRGADMFMKNTAGKSILYEAVEANSFNLELFTDSLRINEALQGRLKNDTGMTSLHIACLFADVELAIKLIREGADVNAQIPSYSPIFQGYTPLHVLVYICEERIDEDIIAITELLVNAGADVTLMNAKSETAVHMASNLLHGDSDDGDFAPLILLLLKAQRDFSVNPTSPDGASHFLIACSMCNTSVIEELLNHCNIDVNRPLDYFYQDTISGNSALHLASWGEEKVIGLAERLKTIDLLLNRGASVEAEDGWGETPLHKFTRYNYLDLFERLARSGADVNARNVEGNTPLYYYLRSDRVSVDGIKVLLRFGCRLNSYNPVTGRGYFGAAVSVLSYKDAQKLISAIAVNFKREMELDNSRRTVIHNMVSKRPTKISASELATLIEQISEKNCDVDDQDDLGRTALHVAAKYNNFIAVSALLMAGADINIVDNSGKTALACDFHCECSNSHDENNSGIGNENDQDNAKCKHLQMNETLALHVRKLQLCRLDLREQNRAFFYKLAIIQTCNDQIAVPKYFLKERETIKSTQIEPHNLTLHNFLCETGAVADYPTIPEIKRNDVDKFFSPSEFQKTRKEFPELANILQLQYRKARARSALLESAQSALALYAGFHLPEIFNYFVFIFLTNTELKNLIESTTQ